MIWLLVLWTRPLGRTLFPSLAAPEKTYPIVANTPNTITVAGDRDLLADGARPGNRYRVLLSTPEADRVDVVYVDAYLDEVDATEDPELLHTFSTWLEAMRRHEFLSDRLKGPPARLRVPEETMDWSLPPASPQL